MGTDALFVAKRTAERTARNRWSAWKLESAAGLVVVGILAGLGVPRILGTRERAAAADAFRYLSAVQAAQERHHALETTYTTAEASLDVEVAPPGRFLIGPITPGPTGDIATSWKQTLTRTEPSGGHGAYTVTFSQEGFEEAASTVDPGLRPPHLRE